MKRIIYTSQAVASVNESVLEDILNTARTENPKHEITGMLLFGDGMFVQVLEGPASKVDHLCENIDKDERHTGFEVLYAEQITERAFGEWSMAYKVLDDQMVEKLGGSMDTKDKDDLVKFLREDDHFVKRFLAACLEGIADAA